jgi:hypothetical protein
MLMLPIERFALGHVCRKMADECGLGRILPKFFY